MTALDGVFYMCYTAYGREFGGSGQPTHPAGGGILPMIARSSNLITWERLGPMVRGEDKRTMSCSHARSATVTSLSTAAARVFGWPTPTTC